MARRNVVARSTLYLLGAIASIAACTNPHSSSKATDTNPTCPDGDCTSSGGSSSGASSGGSSSGELDGGGTSSSSSSGDPGGIDGKKDGLETDIDCGGPSAPKCAVGKGCLVDTDCEIGCSYSHHCVSAPSCKTHLGGDTCGTGEVGMPGAAQEDCCRTLPVSGFTDPAHPGKKVYLDKFEITAGRVRQWIADIARANGGTPNVRDWIAKNRPPIWDTAWDNFLPTDAEGPIIVIARRLLGDPRPEDEDAGGPPGPGVILPPPTDQPRHLGTNYQFNSEVYADLHGGDCGVYSGSYGFPTYYYPPDILARDGQLPRADGTGLRGEKLLAKDFLDAKSMNCITGAMLAAFCAGIL